MAVTPGKVRVPLSPFRGFVNSRPRDEVAIDQFTGASLDWLMTGHGRIRRRPGSLIFGDTLSSGVEVTGILETAIGFLARRMYAASLPSVTDGFPSLLTLYTEEATTGAGTLAFRSSNGTDSWQQVGKDFSATHYPDTGLIYHRVVPMVYENQYGGLTVHRLTNATDRQYLCAGSRDLLLVGGQVCSGGYTSCPVRWNGRFNDATDSGTEALEVYPLGLIPPLQMPTVSKGTSLGASVVGAYKGSDAFFFSVCFENDRGELSMFPVPRPPGSAWSGYDGFGYIQVDSSNPTYYYDSVTISGIADGPPGTRWKRMLRSGKVDVSTTGAGAIVQPAADDLQFWGPRIPQGVTTFTDTSGNDLSLDPDPRIRDMFRQGLQWPPCSRYLGRFDGHATLGCTKPSKYALLLAPWETGAVNYPANNASLYSTVYGVAVTPTHLLLRKVGATTVAKVGATTNGSPIVGLPDTRNVETGKAITGSGIPGATTISSIAPLIDTACATTDGSVTVTVANSALCRVGQLVEGPGIPVGATVATIPGGGVSVTISLPATVTDATCTLRFTQATLSANATASAPGVTFTITVDAVDTAVPLAGEKLRAIVDRVNADASVTNTTFTGATWSMTFLGFSIGIIDLNAALVIGTNVNIGDKVISAAFPSDTTVTHIEGPLGAQHIGVSHGPTRANTGASEPVTLQQRAASTDFRYAAGVVPGADADEQADNLLRTLVVELCTYGSADTTLQLDDITNAEYITPGMHVSGSNIPATAIVTAVNEATGVVTITPASTGTGTAASVEFYYDMGDATSTTNNGYMRMFGNALPAPVFWRKSYLDQFTPELNATAFSAASPGYAQDGVNTWLRANRHSGAPDTFGALMGMADLGPFEIQFFARARMRLWNPRTGETHNDADYTQSTVSWTSGARSPYAICAGTGFAISLSEEGLYATQGGMGDERTFSKAIYDPTALPGRRGELEYAIKACVAASESDSDAYKLSAVLIGRVLHVRYYSDSDATTFDREIRYDFSAGGDRDGYAALFRPDGSEWAWSTPQNLPIACSVLVPKADGFHHYAARDTNAGTGDGRVDEIDTGTTDNGTVIRPVGYTGTLVPEDMSQLQPLRFGLLVRKAGSGVYIGCARDSEKDHADMQFDDVAASSTNGQQFGREVLSILPGARTIMGAVTVRIRDDGSGECPELSRANLYADPYDPTYAKGGQ